MPLSGPLIKAHIIDPVGERKIVTFQCSGKLREKLNRKKATLNK